MPRHDDERYEDIHSLLTHLDLHYHSLKLVGQELISENPESAALNEKALRLSKECSKVIRATYDFLDSEDLELSESALNRVEPAIRRASEAKAHTLRAVQIWRVIEATDRYLATISPKYDYVRLSQKLALEALEKREEQNAQLTSLFNEYKEAMAADGGAGKAAEVPFSSGILRWRGSQLFYLERISRGARWIELDPDHEPQTLDDDEEEGVELVEARTIEGHLIRLRLDPTVDEGEVDRYLHDQQLSPYIVAGSQVAREQRRRIGPRT